MDLHNVALSCSSDSESEHEAYNQADRVRRSSLEFQPFFDAFKKDSSQLMMGSVAPNAGLRDKVYMSENPFGFLKNEESDDDANISDLEEEDSNPTMMNNGMISQQPEGFAKKNETPADFFIVRNNSASTHFTEESSMDPAKQNSIMSFGSGLMGSINPTHDKAQMMGAQRWTHAEAVAGDESFSDDE
mmetsp:Transcript_12340/g.19168  ORF Transcript_12340/g.19168 Transcript_12340/m.19168 type:complete len:188 (-) Transcript_12340:249-812(-)|eukprot:CAMPEP_0170484694 /NCGR_PEP_ID=MMETSP0208-20121228/4098_1 /TAXON_ID=197538 /ORGANISM="Strombidium inclinatum, Strain S3" /LENGTH=187 /DNA_ID=CAMNT_0010758087 /DNA_START=35 /DNA_END=598 /DNA_ORIENTATION=-